MMLLRAARLLALAVVAWVFGGEAHAQFAEAARVYFSTGFELLKSGDKPGAIAAFWLGLRIAPNNAQAHYYIGVTLFSMDPGEYPVMRDYKRDMWESDRVDIDAEFRAPVLYRFGGYHLRRAVEIGGSSREVADAERRLAKVEALYRFLRAGHAAARVPHYPSDKVFYSSEFFYCAGPVVMGVELEGRSNPFQITFYTDDTASRETIRGAVGNSGHDWSAYPALGKGYNYAFTIADGLEPQISDRKAVFPGKDILFGDDPTLTMEFNADSSARVELSYRGRAALSGTVVPCLTKTIFEQGVASRRLQPIL